MPAAAADVWGVAVDGAVTDAAVGGLVVLTVADEVAAAATVGGFTAVALGDAVLIGGLDVPTSAAECVGSTEAFGAPGVALGVAPWCSVICATALAAAVLPVNLSRFGNCGNAAGASADEPGSACDGEETSHAMTSTTPHRQSVPQGPTSGSGATSFLIALC